jgi:hypothetical protein
MSWVKSVSVSGDDVFDEDADDISLQNKEWKHNMEKRVKVVITINIYEGLYNIIMIMYTITALKP